MKSILKPENKKIGRHQKTVKSYPTTGNILYSENGN